MEGSQFKFEKPEKLKNHKKQKIELTISENGEVKSDSPFAHLFTGQDEGVAEKDKIPDEREKKQDDLSVHVPFMITHDMEQQLADKGLTKKEISKLSPEFANFILNNYFPARETEKTIQNKESIEKISEEISNVKNLDELIEIIKKNGGIQGLHDFYKADDLVTRIQLLKNGSPLINLAYVADDYGLRDKVQELLQTHPSDLEKKEISAEMREKINIINNMIHNNEDVVVKDKSGENYIGRVFSFESDNLVRVKVENYKYYNGYLSVAVPIDEFLGWQKEKILNKTNIRPVESPVLTEEEIRILKGENKEKPISSKNIKPVEWPKMTKEEADLLKAVKKEPSSFARAEMAAQRIEEIHKKNKIEPGSLLKSKIDDSEKKPENKSPKGPDNNKPESKKEDGGIVSPPGKRNAERYGFKDKNLVRGIGNGLINIIGTIFGARFVWEVPKLISENYKKGEVKSATLDFLDSVIENNANKSANFKLKEFDEKLKRGGTKEELGKIEEERDKLKNELNGNGNGNEKESLPVRAKIKDFNEKLKNIKLPEVEKMQLRNQMAKILNEHRHATESIDKKRAKKVGKVLDVFANNSEQAITVAREVANTASIFAMMPWMRSISYTALASIGSAMKISNEYDKKHFNDDEKTKLAEEMMSPAEKIASEQRLEKLGGENKGFEKISYIAKALTVDSAKETYNSLIGNFVNKDKNGKKMPLGKAVLGAFKKVATLAGTTIRLAGIAEFEHALQTGNLMMTEGNEKVMEALKSGQIGEVLKQGGQNWINNTNRLLNYVHLPNITVGVATNHLINLPQDLVGKEKLDELATVHKGEGIIHTFQRQIEHNPHAFGYHGNMNDSVAIHKFAQTEGYKIALQDGYVKPDGSETRILDTKNPVEFILHKDHSVTEVNTHGHEYTFNHSSHNPTEIPKSSNSSISKTPDTSEIERVQTVDNRIENIYKSDSILPSQPEEWDRVRHLQARDFLAGHFGTPVGELDMVEAQDRIQLQDYIKELENKFHVEPGPHEPIEAFILRANKIHSLDLKSIAGFKEYKEHLDKILGVKKHIEDIYKWHFGPFSGSQIEEWKTVRGLNAVSFLAGKNIPIIGHQLDAVELGNRQEMQDYLRSLINKTHIPLRVNETIEAYIARTNKISIKDFRNIFNINA